MAKGFKTGGRTKGTPNKISITLKNDILEAYELEGGVEWVRKLMREDMRTAASLLRALIPSELIADVTSNHEITFVTRYEDTPSALTAAPITAALIEATPAVAQTISADPGADDPGADQD